MRYKHFNKTERLELSILLKKGYLLRNIGQTLRRNPSSVSRKLRKYQRESGVRELFSPKDKVKGGDLKDYFFICIS